MNRKRPGSNPFLTVALAAVVLVAVCPEVSRAAEKLIAAGEFDTATKKAKSESRPVFVHFTTSWSGSCDRLRDRIYPTDEVAPKLARFVRSEIDIDTDKGQALAERFQASIVPTLVLLAPDGTEWRDLRIEGLRSAAELAETLDKGLARMAGTDANADTAKSADKSGPAAH